MAAGSSRQQQQQDTVVPPYVKALSGSLGGIVEASCLQPIDVIKTRLQLDTARQYRGIANCGVTIVKSEGVRALWKGLTPFATHLTLKYTLRMGTNALLQTFLADSDTGKLSSAARLASGFGAGVLEALVIVTPFEIVLDSSSILFVLGWSVTFGVPELRDTWCRKYQEGILGLWSGALPTVMRNGINQAAMFTAKNTFDSMLWKKHEGDGRTLQPWQSMASGFLAGCVGPVCTGPFDVVKTRLMAQSKKNPKYSGMFHAIATIRAEEGVLALWKGLLPRLMRIPPGQAIMWAVADQITGFYERKFVLPSPSSTSNGVI
ncbi:hypothetical protein SELMODRAFT_447706 [Selaginella moellendorffii]|uniref:MC family transporter n=1 Tax=Selaginella moellendorffii TaxID=88036 RepID=D8T1Q6_SELML|nr:hypothetical protein SELMODRAFT_447706 [Selaginella moellendorffii]